jgi:hypothetical protein
MAIVIKTNKFDFLYHFVDGLQASNLLNLKNHGAKIAIEGAKFSFIGAQGNTLSKGLLPCTFDFLKNEFEQLPQSKVDICKSELKNAIDLALHKILNGETSSPVVVATEVKSKGMPVSAVIKALQDVPLIALRDATSMYQRVKGTSAHAVYVVVAVNEDVRVAAKVVGTKVSMRVEGNITPAVTTKMLSHGFSSNGVYMSAHYSCPENVTPDKVIGSVLVGCGLQFDTPIPIIEIVRGLSK